MEMKLKKLKPRLLGFLLVCFFSSSKYPSMKIEAVKLLMNYDFWKGNLLSSEILVFLKQCYWKSIWIYWTGIVWVHTSDIVGSSRPFYSRYTQGLRLLRSKPVYCIDPSTPVSSWYLFRWLQMDERPSWTLDTRMDKMVLSILPQALTILSVHRQLSQ